ncbi:roundabout homolog 3-like isoform X1 [Acanthaster planci]|uniref:Roundabout homolog 3-like isoform X1 n=1 Tax=Acanthaster planci TaxID=133434 RepID=A0A8B7YIP3_ACAPL|nr:roundabout homolog 3-like isoform X1 [Acanthaster planci]
MAFGIGINTVLLRLASLAFVFMATLHSAKSLELEVEDDNRYPVAESDVVLTCYGAYDGILTFSGNPQGKVVWMKDGQPIAEWPKPAGTETPTRYDLSADAPEDGAVYAYLTIRSMDTTDNGAYRCQLLRGETVLGTSYEVRLTVEQRPASEYPKCSVLTLSNEQVFLCESERGSPPVSLQWWKGEQPLNKTDLDVDGFVQARFAAGEEDESNAGRFECSLTFREQRTGSCVLDRPSVAIPAPTSGLLLGQDLIVVCVTSGNPPVSIVDWDFKPSLFSSFGKDGNTLTIYNISSRDNGTQIICEGHNALGSNQASRVITLRPLEATVQPITVQLEQTKVPTSLDEQAQFKCVTTPPRSPPPPPCIWHYNGEYVDPDNTSDRFLVEDRSEHVLSVSSVTTMDVGASVTCHIVVSYRPNAEVFLRATFPQTTKAAPVLTTTRRPPKSGPSLSDKSWPFSTQMGYIIGGLMCLVLVGICCWVSLKAKSLLCSKPSTKNDEKPRTRTKASCNRLDNDFIVDIGMPPELTARPSIVTKLALAEEESPYQDLEDVSRQRQINEYQRLISNDWAPPAPEPY